MANMVKLQYKSYMFLDLKYVWSLSFQFSNNQDPQHKIYMDCDIAFVMQILMLLKS